MSVFVQNNELAFSAQALGGRDPSDTTIELKTVKDDAANVYFAARQGPNAVMALAVENQYINQFNDLARQHNARVLAARAEKAAAKVTNDALPTKSKKPQPDLAKEQVVSTAGDTVAIVFCKRVGDVGGTWIQPPMIKTGSNDFVGSFLYVISQGEMASNPVKHYSWVGSRSIKFLADQTITLTHYYESVATLTAAINTCPITSGKIFCDLDVFSFLAEEIKLGSVTIRYQDYRVLGHRLAYIVRGTGSTTNSVFFCLYSDLTVFDNKTGGDITATYLTFLGITSPSTVAFYPTSSTQGHAVGAIVYKPPTYPNYIAPIPNIFTNFGSTGTITEVWGNFQIFNQINPALPASTGTLTSLKVEEHDSAFQFPLTPPSTEDYTNFADITFLEIDGNIYDPPDEGSYPTTTRQISLYYDNGVNVDLYSGGLISGQYAVGPSNQFVDLAMYLFTLMKRANGSATSDISTPIDVTNFTTLAAFCTGTGLLFNGIVDQSTNIIDYISKTAPFFFLTFISSNGQYSLKPALPLNSSNLIKSTALTPAETFDETNIIPGSFSKTFFNLEERRNVSISLMWREADPVVIGLQRTTTVRYPSSAIDVVTVQYDMTDFCSSAAHAAIYGKYELARRKYSTHSISFATPLSIINLLPSDIIKVERQRINSVGDNRVETDHYQIINISHEASGSTSIQAEHFPLNGSNIAIISTEVLSGTFEVI